MTGPLLLFLHAVCPLFFFTDLTRNPYAAQIYLLQIGLCLAVAGALARSLRRGVLALRPAPTDIPLLTWMCVALASWAASWVMHPALRSSVAAEGWRAHVFLGANLLAPYFLVRATAPAWESRIRAATLAVGAVAAAYGLLQYAGIEWVWDKALNPYNGRPVSTFGNPNFLSSYLVMLLPFALGGFMTARGTRRAYWGALALLYGAALICTMTRSSWIGAACAVSIFLFLRRPRGGDLKAVAVLGGILAALALFWPGSPLSHAESTPVQRMWELARGVGGKEVYGSWHQRLLIWSCSAEMLKDNILLGKGWGCFELFYPFYQGPHLLDPVLRVFRTHANNAHNIVMEIVSQTGLIGAGIAAWLGWTGVAALRRAWPAWPEDRRWLAAARTAAVCGMLADNFFGNVSLFFAVPGFLFAWTAGGLAQDTAGPVRETSLRRPALAAAVLVLLSAAGAMAVWCVRAWRADVLYFQGYKRSQRGDLVGAQRFLEASGRWRPREVNNAYELANTYLRQGQSARQNGLQEEPRRLFTLAVAAYEDALAANAGYDEIHYNMASALMMLGRPLEAAAHLRSSVEINPLNEQAHRLLGAITMRELADPAAAREVFARALRVFPENGEFRRALEGLEKAAPPP